MAYVENVDLVPEGTRTAAGSQPSVANFGGSTQAILHVRITDIDSYLYVRLEDSVDGENWYLVETLNASLVGNYALRTNKPFTDNLRVSWTLQEKSGLPLSATFAVSLAAF